MFERYTEKARRVIFFARYEASQYGAASIETEHILLALLREDRTLMHYLRLDLSPDIRDEIEKVIHQGTRVSTSVEMPLSADSQKILQFAGEEADRVAQRYVAPHHILLGILRVEKSLAAKLLMAKGAKLDAIRIQIAHRPASLAASAGTQLSGTTVTSLFAAGSSPAEAVTTLDRFLQSLKAGASDQLAGFFNQIGQFVDFSGRRWLGRDEIEKGAETLLAPFAKRSASFRVEDTTVGPSQTFVASVLWEIAAASGGHSKSMLRMSIVFAWADEDWTILLVQTTPVVFG